MAGLWDAAVTILDHTRRNTDDPRIAILCTGTGVLMTSYMVLRTYRSLFRNADSLRQDVEWYRNRTHLDQMIEAA